jgi:hypothetical protein
MATVRILVEMDHIFVRVRMAEREQNAQKPPNTGWITSSTWLSRFADNSRSIRFFHKNSVSYQIWLADRFGGVAPQPARGSAAANAPPLPRQSLLRPPKSMLDRGDSMARSCVNVAQATQRRRTAFMRSCMNFPHHRRVQATRDGAYGRTVFEQQPVRESPLGQA